MKENNKAIALAMAAVLSWSTVATAFKKTLEYLSHFEMLIVASLTSLVIFAIVLTVQRKWKDLAASREPHPTPHPASPLPILCLPFRGAIP